MTKEVLPSDTLIELDRELPPSVELLRLSRDGGPLHYQYEIMLVTGRLQNARFVYVRRGYNRTNVCYFPLDARIETFGLQEQPAPKPNDGPVLWDLVIEDMRARNRVGRERYGVPLQAHNGRDALRDAYEECLDMAVYLKQAIVERDTTNRCACGRRDNTGKIIEDSYSENEYLEP